VHGVQHDEVRRPEQRELKCIDAVLLRSRKDADEELRSWLDGVLRPDGIQSNDRGWCRSGFLLQHTCDGVRLCQDDVLHLYVAL
jgi:hypothetical protein